METQTQATSAQPASLTCRLPLLRPPDPPAGPRESDQKDPENNNREDPTCTLGSRTWKVNLLNMGAKMQFTGKKRFN